MTQDQTYVKPKRPFKNGLKPAVLALQCLAPYAAHDSASRAVMHSSHITQALPIANSEEKYIQTGHECDLGQYTFNVSMPHSGTIRKIIPRYPIGDSKNSIPVNPETLIIYERDNGQIDCFTLPYFCTNHQYFGFPYKLTPAASQLREGRSFSKGTIFATSPGVKEGGGYGTGINAETAFMSIKEVAEDAMVVSRSFAQQARYYVYDTRIIDVDKNHIPINLHGKNGRYQPWPEIGDEIRHDGLLAVTREYNPILAPVTMGKNWLNEPDYLFDQKYFVRPGIGRVVDIKILRNYSIPRAIPEEIAEFLDKYTNAYHHYHREIITFAERLRAQQLREFNSAEPNFSEEFTSLVFMAQGLTNHPVPGGKTNINLLHRKEVVPEYRVEITVEYLVDLGVGNKISDQNGGKGVIVEVWEDERMPVDAAGNRAQVISDDKSIISRMNLGRPMEPFFASVPRDLKKDVCAMLGLAIPVHRAEAEAVPLNQALEAVKFLIPKYRVMAPHMADILEFEFSPQEKREFLIDHVLIPKIHSIQIPVESPVSPIDAAVEIDRIYPRCFGPVSYMPTPTERVTTIEDVRIAPLYTYVLEKTAASYAATSSAKLQHHGFLSPVIRSDKFELPFRGSPTRFMGETEGRLLACYCPPALVAELHDRSNNPQVQRVMYDNVLKAEYPTNIECVVDRQLYPLGNSRVTQLISHMLACQGIELVWTPGNQALIDELYPNGVK